MLIGLFEFLMLTVLDANCSACKLRKDSGFILEVYHDPHIHYTYKQIIIDISKVIHELMSQFRLNPEVSLDKK